MDQAHDSVVWSISWHPLGHILASGSNDHTVKFFTRNRLGDKMTDKYNLNLVPKGQDGDEEEMLNEFDENNVEAAAIPGLGLEEMSNQMEQQQSMQQNTHQQHQQQMQRKVPFSKKIPRQFENQWSDSNHHNHHNHHGNKNKRTKINHPNNARYHNHD